MTTVRRRILRPQREQAASPREEARQQRQRAKLAKHRLSLKRWLTRLKGSANTVSLLHQQIARLESQVTGQ
jgi:hypothetical protein